MATLTLQEKYEALKDAYYEGTIRVKYADKEVEYRSLEEMETILQKMEVELGLRDGGLQTTFAVFNKGV